MMAMEEQKKRLEKFETYLGSHVGLLTFTACVEV